MQSRQDLIDSKTIEECQAGNLQNFRKIVDYSSPLVFSVALRMLGDEDEATDVVQETMITVWKKIGRIKSAGSYRTWLYRIAVNKCYDVLRQRKRSSELTCDDEEWKKIGERISVNPGAGADNEEIAGVIRALTSELSPKQKAVFVLSDLEEMPAEEICRITGMSNSNIKANLHYARKKIAELVKNYL